MAIHVRCYYGVHIFEQSTIALFCCKKIRILKKGTAMEELKVTTVNNVINSFEEQLSKEEGVTVISIEDMFKFAKQSEQEE